MPTSKTDKKRKDKKEAFKENAKKEAAQAAIPKTHLIPQTSWQTTDMLDLRGDLLEAFEKNMVLTYEALQQAQMNFSHAAQVLQMIMSTNVKSGKINLSYVWNNGEPASEEEVNSFKAKMEEINKLRQEQATKIKQEANSEKTGLVGPGGEPIGTDQNLDEEEQESETNE